MPELPEVETVVRQLRPRLVGRTVIAITLRWAGVLAWPGLGGGLPPRTFRQRLLGRRILAVDRRAKYFVLRCDGAISLVGHLRMTGRLVVTPARQPSDVQRASQRWVRAEFQLDDGTCLLYIDTRKFGRLTAVRALDEALPELGPEPLGPQFTAQWLQAQLRSHRRQMKPLLLDQAFLAGLGNIYVDESLHRAGIHPRRVSNEVTRPQAVRLHRAIRTVLTRAVSREGSSFDAFYRTPEGRPGGYQDEFAVYGRSGELCRRCATPIQKTLVGQRGTHHCPRCQRAPQTTRQVHTRSSRANLQAAS
ncbi:MAG: bifunctional DNA-formamidopyrimidine glycosylase/DNA-(apurinic or apyrimidinic site) lyase [Planctomycetota bacterium]